MKSVSYLSILRAYLTPLWGRTLLLLLLLLLGAGLTIISPQIMAAFIDQAFLGGEQPLMLLALLFLAAALINQGITVATTYLGTDIGLRASNQVRADLTLHCLQLDMSFHHGTTPGALIERIDGDVSRMNQFLANFAVLLLRNALLIIGVLIALWLIDWRAGAIIGSLLVLALLALEFTRRYSLGSIKEEREASAQLFGTIEERLAGAEDIRANGGVDYVMQRFYERSRAWVPSFVRSHLVGAATWPISRLLFAISLISAFGVAAWLVGEQAITLGLGFAIYRYIDLIRWPMLYLGRQFQDLQQAGAALIRIGELLDTRSSITYSGDTQLPERALAVDFDRVTFSYGGSASVETTQTATIHDLSFHLPAGESLGLLGRTGSGKTTIARLLLRLYDPQSGTIRLDQRSLPSLSAEALRAGVGLVSQDIQLFHTSIRNNLSLFAELPDERLLGAIQLVGLGEWLKQQPQGLDTIIAANGMSAGQAQLLAFARAWLHNPGLLILDEASSRLDPATEQQLEQALGELLHGRSAIIIAHRLATIQRVDWIMLIDQGRCIEFGRRAELAANPHSHFAQLLRTGAEEVLA